MEHGPIVLLGQGEQYDDPADWRELIRARRIRRGVELPVRRDGLTTLVRPEEVPEIAAVLDHVDPPETAPSAAPSLQAAPAPARGASVPASTPLRSAPARSPVPPSAKAPAKLPTAGPRKRRFLGVWVWVLLVGGLVLIRLCAPDGFSWPALGARSDEGAEYAPATEGRGRGACAAAHGWIARAACEDPGFAGLRPQLAQAYTARVAAAPASERADLAAEQQRWTAGRAVCRTDAAPSACLARLYRARIAELQTSTALAPPASAEAPGAPARAAPEQAALVSRPEWLRRPTPDDVFDAYPEQALRLEAQGRALLSCRATASGALTACDIVSEDPPDFGFGGAALRLSRLYQLRPLTTDGRSVEGAKVDVPVVFKAGP